MTTSYLGRFACQSLAAFFLAHTALAGLVSLVARSFIGRVIYLSPSVASRLLIALRLLPAGGAGLFVAVICIPSYLLFEPGRTLEQIGPVLLIAALFGFAICLSGLFRGVSAVIRSSRYLSKHREDEGLVFLLAGVFRPRLIISRAVRVTLTDEEFEVALRHEQAHAQYQDNLKRLLILISPNVFPFSGAFLTLETTWRRVAEWAADDSAVADSPERALALASALIRLSRALAVVTPQPLFTSLLADTDDLRMRIERLIAGSPVQKTLPRNMIWGIALMVIAASFFAPATLRPVHQFLEAFTR